MIPVIIGDRVLIATGLCLGRRGVVKRTQRQSKGEKKALFWVELGPGEEHAFLREEFVWDGHVYESGQAPRPATKGDE